MANKIMMATSMMRVWLTTVVKVIVMELLLKGKLRQEGGST